MESASDSDSDNQSITDELMNKIQDEEVGEELLDYIDQLLEVNEQEEKEGDAEENMPPLKRQNAFRIPKEYQFTELEMAEMEKASDEEWDKIIKNIVKKGQEFEKLNHQQKYK